MKLFVRIAPAVKIESFRRCGLQFSREWAAVEVDEATARRLMAEQMLETREPELCVVKEGTVKEGAEGAPSSDGTPEKVSAPKASKARAKK